MKPETQTAIDTALRGAMASLSPSSRAWLPNHVDAEAREAFAVVIRTIDVEVIVDLAAHVALDRFLQLAGDEDEHSEEACSALKH